MGKVNDGQGTQNAKSSEGILYDREDASASVCVKIQVMRRKNERALIWEAGERTENGKDGRGE